MILIIDSTRQDLPLLRYEFVNPLISIVQKAGFRTCTQPLGARDQPDDGDGIILSGTALKDLEFLKTGLPGWIADWKGPILGICAGMQLLAISSGGTLTRGETIGMTDISVVSDDRLFSGKETFSAWELHQSEVIVPDTCHILAVSSSAVRAFRIDNTSRYGVLFHPEVRNDWIIHNFLSICDQ